MRFRESKHTYNSMYALSFSPSLSLLFLFSHDLCHPCAVPANTKNRLYLSFFLLTCAVPLFPVEVQRNPFHNLGTECREKPYKHQDCNLQRMTATQAWTRGRKRKKERKRKEEEEGDEREKEGEEGGEGTKRRLCVNKISHTPLSFSNM